MRTNIQKENGKKGKVLYCWNLLSSLMTHKRTQTEIVIDGRLIKNNTFSISLMIGRYSGRCMRQTPNALPDDGLFDVTIIKKNEQIDSDTLIHLEAV